MYRILSLNSEVVTEIKPLPQKKIPLLQKSFLESICYLKTPQPLIDYTYIYIVCALCPDCYVTESDDREMDNALT